MSKKQKMFIAISIAFFIGVVFFVWDMSRSTTKPWGKKDKAKTIQLK